MIAELYPQCQALLAEPKPRALETYPHYNSDMEYQREHVARIITSFVKERQDRGVSRRETARELGVDEKTLRNLEDGTTAPRIITIYKICSQLNLHVLDFLGERDALVKENAELRRAVRDAYQTIGAVQGMIEQGMPGNDQGAETG